MNRTSHSAPQNGGRLTRATDPAPPDLTEQTPIELRIDGLGSEGDGVAREREAPLHVRYALPGELVLAQSTGRNRATATSILQSSPDRVAPPCGLFGLCGGCVIQHLDRAAALTWKTGLVTAALQSAGFTLPGHIPASQSAPASRRRMDLAIRRGAEGVVIGLHRRGSDEVVALTECHVLDPALFAMIGALQPVLTRVHALRRTGSLHVNLLATGPDILLSTEGTPDSRDRTVLAAFAAEHGVPRIAWQPEGGGVSETICSLAPATHTLDGITIQPPPGAFLQATRHGEEAIVNAVLASLSEKMPRSARIVELYAGCGTISFALSKRARVVAYDGQADAIACLRSAGSTNRIEAIHRDLNRQPVMVRDLTGAAAIVLDPPHAGAGAQMQEVAASAVPRIVYVSCNPTALAQDSRRLALSGYRLERLSVVDQFLWSPRVESVSLFTKTTPTRRGPLPWPPRT